MEIFHDLLSQVISKIQNSIFNFYAIQLDETADIANMAQLCVYVRYKNENHLEDEFLFCEALSTRTTAAEIFSKVDNFFVENGIQWEHAIGVYAQMEHHKCWDAVQGSKRWWKKNALILLVHTAQFIAKLL